MKNRFFSFLIPLFLDGSLGLTQTAMPILAVGLHANEMMLGAISWVAQTVRLPICLTSGPLSERVGRKKLMLPALFVYTCATLLFTRATANFHLIILYSLILGSIGVFYPSFQAHIGDVSKRGQLTRNLGSFNMGWCIGGGTLAVAAGFLVTRGLDLTFCLAAVGSVGAGVLVLIWTNGHQHRAAMEEAMPPAAEDTGSLLFIARMGLFTGYFAYAAIRILFPRMGLVDLGWSKPWVAWTVAALPIGQGFGMITTTASPWWRGKLWPQLAAQATMLAGAATVVMCSSTALLMAAFFAIGFALSVAYTAALYHGLSLRKDRGKNSGIHEALVAGGGFAGSLLGGVLADSLSPRAPYVALGILAVGCLMTTAVIASGRAAGKGSRSARNNGT